MKLFCEDLKDQAMKIIDYEKKEMIPLTDEEKESYENQEICHICEKEFCTDENNKKFKKMHKVRDHCHYTGKYRGAAHRNGNLNYKGYFHCLGENTEKYITFSVPIKKVLDSDNGSDNDSDSNNDNDKDKNKVKTITYRIKFIDSCRFMQDSLSNLVDNLSEINNKEPKINLLIA